MSGSTPTSNPTGPAAAPDSVSAATDADRAAGDDTVSAGAMHLAGGSHLQGGGHGDIQFLGAGTAAPGGDASLQVDFVDLSAAGAGSLHAAASDPALIRFADWQPVNADTATVGGAAGFGAALDQAASAMLGDFSTATSAGVAGAANGMDAPARPGGAAVDAGTVRLVHLPLIIHP